MGRTSVAGERRPTAATNRRDHRRSDVTRAIRLEIELHGVDGQDDRREICGETMNISRSGMLARVDQDVPRESRCVIYFPNGQGVVGRTMVYGRVRRVGEGSNGWAVAVQFDTRLDQVQGL